LFVCAKDLLDEAAFHLLIDGEARSFSPTDATKGLLA